MLIHFAKIMLKLHMCFLCDIPLCGRGFQKGNLTNFLMISSFGLILIFLRIYPLKILLRSLKKNGNYTSISFQDKF